MIKRKCSICNIEKELTKDNFHSDKSRNFGFMYNCKCCEIERGKKKYAANPRLGRYAEYTEQQKKDRYVITSRYAKTPKGRAIALIAAYQQFDYKRGYENNITKDFLIKVRAEYKCIYCGYPSTGLDRINNKAGHTFDNCVPCCLECNVARMDNFTHTEMMIIGASIKQVKDLRKN